MQQVAPQVLSHLTPSLSLSSSQKYPGGHLSIYFASQTGTAESLGKVLQREGAENGFFVHVIDLEDIEVDDLLDAARQHEETGTSRAVFCIATYGEGEPTDNSASFVMDLKTRACTEILKEEEKKESENEFVEQCLEGLEYSVFGLGNRQYEHFNAMSKFFDSTLEKVGGKRVLPTGYGDDDNDLEGDFENWKDNVFWPNMKKLYLSDADLPALKGDQDELPETPYQVEYLDTSDVKPDMEPASINNASRPYFTSYDCPVSVVRELRTKQDPGSTVHMEIDISKADGLEYVTADNLGVLPLNASGIVESVAESLGYDLDATFSVKAARNKDWKGAPFPSPVSVRECLTRYCDLSGALRRSDLKQLAPYAQDPTDKKALLRLSSKEGKAEYKEKVLDAQKGLADILKLCPSIEAPLEHFLMFCPRLIPRFYTISSSSSEHPKSVHITVSVSENTRKDGSVFKGVCSSYLAGLKPGKETVRVFNRDSTFRLPKDTSRPIVMIGPGTGVAPMRALLQERAFQRKTEKKTVGKSILYFGCKKRSMDFIYEKEMKAFQKDGTLNDLHLAFSRENKEKVYVQHLLAKNAKSTWQLLEKDGAYVYVCGGVKMGNDVSEALQTICEQEGSMSKDDAKSYMKNLAANGRYVQELWA